MTGLRIGIALAPLLLAAAPAADPALRAMQAKDARVARIAWALQTASIGLCTTVSPLPGFTVHSLGQYAPADRARVRAAFGLDARPAVLAVVPGSAAAKAGLRAGDTIAVLGATPTAAALTRKADYRVTADAEDRIEAGLAGDGLQMRIERDGAVETVTLAGDRGCASRVQVIGGTRLAAQADGRYVQLSDGAVDLADSDDALAALMGHELAHNFLAHRARLDAAKVTRGVFAGLGKSGARYRATELEADRLSVWIVARGGYSVDAIVPFWRRWAATSGVKIGDGTHPGWSERLARIAAAVAEVKAQQARGAALVPAQ